MDESSTSLLNFLTTENVYQETTTDEKSKLNLNGIIEDVTVEIENQLSLVMLLSLILSGIFIGFLCFVVSRHRKRNHESSNQDETKAILE